MRIDVPASLACGLARMAPAAVAGKLADGLGFEVRTGELSAVFPGDGSRVWFFGQPVAWSRSSVSETGGGWRFRVESAGGLLAESLLTPVASHRAATIRPRLTNTAARDSEPIVELSALFLRLVKIAEAPRVMSSTGGAYAYEYPPYEAFYTRWHVPQGSGFPPLKFGHGDDGRSSSKDLPILMVAVDAAPDAPGFFFGMEWSAMWQGQIGYEADGEGVRVSLGPEARGVILAPGESLDLPTVHVGFYEGGVTNGTNALRRYIADWVTPRYQGKAIAPPVCYTIWPGIVAPYTEKDLYPQVDAAAELGVEMFIVDDAWYPGDFPRGCGNWRPDPVKFPSGLDRFADYVASKGMGFGLFFDAEIAEEGTTILQEHPGFFYPRVRGGYRHRYLYDYTQPSACDYVVQYIGEFIERYDLRYIRWDYNVHPIYTWREKDPTNKIVFKHLAGLYEVWERITSRYPQLVLECCAGGGQRLDLGTMRRHHTCWMNDNMINPHVYHTMLLGAHTFVPGNYLGASVGWPIGPQRIADTTLPRYYDRGLPDLSFISRLPGLLFLHGRLGDWSPETKRRARHWVEVYRRIRHLLVKDYYRLLRQPQSEADWDAAQFTDGNNGAIFAFRNIGTDKEKHVRPRVIDPNSRYVLRDEANGAERTLSGAELVERGLSIELAPHSACLLTYRSL